MWHPNSEIHKDKLRLSWCSKNNLSLYHIIISLGLSFKIFFLLKVVFVYVLYHIHVKIQPKTNTLYRVFNIKFRTNMTIWASELLCDSESKDQKIITKTIKIQKQTIKKITPKNLTWFIIMIATFTDTENKTSL